MKEQFRVATECAERISETFIKPIELEMEKVMYPFLLLVKSVMLVCIMKQLN